MKTIGFVDYYLSEWHANNYPAWIQEANEKLGEDFVVKYAWAERDISPVDGVSTDGWCEKFGVERCATLQELCQKADYILVLAPSNPEVHLRYAQEVLKYRKNTYIDKTFAPDFQTAQEIFALGKEYGTKFFSSSALRYASELEGIVGAKSIITTGGGGSLEEYIVHQAEMVVKTVGMNAERVRVEKQGETQFVCSVRFQGGRAATMLYAPCYGFRVCAEKANGETVEYGIGSDFFRALILDILRFYASGELPFEGEQTLEVMKIRSGVIKGMNALGEWMDL